MKNHKQSPVIGHNILVTLGLFLLWGRQVVAAASTVPVGLFLDDECKYASTLIPNFDAPLNTCVITAGAFGVLVESSATCPDGSAVHYDFFYSSGCPPPDVLNSFYVETGDCASLVDKPIPAFIAYCGSANQLQVASTTTIQVGTNIVSTPTATTTASGNRSTSSTPAGSVPTESPSSSASDGSGWSGLSYGERLGIIISLAVGIPAIALAACQVYYMRRRHH